MKTISTHHYYLGFTLQLIASFFLVVGIRGLFVDSFIVHFIISISCVFALTFSEGIELNKADRKYRNYHSIFFFKIGNWQPLPEVSQFELAPNESRSRLDASRHKIVARLINGETLIMSYYKNLAKAEKELNRLNTYFSV